MLCKHYNHHQVYFYFPKYFQSLISDLDTVQTIKQSVREM